MTQTASDYRRRPGERQRARPMFGGSAMPTQTPQTAMVAPSMFGGPVVVPAGSHPGVLAQALQSFRQPRAQMAQPQMVARQPMAQPLARAPMASKRSAPACKT